MTPRTQGLQEHFAGRDLLPPRFAVENEVDLDRRG
jgi:hypothetical protein